MAPAPNTAHQTVSLSLRDHFIKAFKSHKCRMFVAPFDVKLPISKGLKDATVVQPDLLVVCDESKLDKRGCNGSPDLVVEILSKSNQ